MRIVHYSQHVLGVGHFFRSLEIAKALAPHRVDLITGGEQVPVSLPEHVQHVPLPALSMDGNFRKLLSSRSGNGTDDPGLIASIMEERRTRLLDHVHQARPDIFLVELFPFGRKRFGFEILPVLQGLKVLRGLRNNKPKRCTVVCSVRDILVEKSDQAGYEQRVLNHLNDLFDMVLVHADPNLVRLDETFSRVADIMPDVRYTGYVCPVADSSAGAALRRELGLKPADRLLVASVGGGAVGGELLQAVLEASCILHPRLTHQLQIFTGPFMDQQTSATLHHLAAAHDHIRIEPFTDRFSAWLSAANLSVSMAGYNTTMNLLATGTYGMVLPFAQNREQTMRALRLELRGALTVLRPEQLRPEELADLLHRTLTGPTAPNMVQQKSPGTRIDINGAATTATILASLCADSEMAHD